MTSAEQFIAVVDDDILVLRALQRLLLAWSHRVHTFENAKSFLASLQYERPECLIVDLHMPEMDGLELQRHLKQSGVDIPTIVITAEAQGDTSQRCKSAGAVALLTKPLEDRSLLAAIDAARQHRN
jgi:FixJ family two-component response regulator